MPDAPVVAVLGGGITGLSACWRLVKGGARVVLLERSSTLGGKIRTEDFEGRPLDAGPDAFLARVPEATDLCRELGLGEELVATATDRAFIWTRGRLRALPQGLVLGVPTDLPALARAGVLGPLGLARAALDVVLPAKGAARSGDDLGRDRSVGEIVRDRFGGEALERLVDPLIGGIHAGRSDELSAAATAPQLFEASRSSRSVLVGLRRARRSAASPSGDAGPGSAFLTLRGGLGVLVGRLANGLRDAGADVRPGSSAVSISRNGSDWRIATTDGRVDARGLVIATPAPETAKLLAECVPLAASELRSVEHSSVSVVTLAYDQSAVPGPLAGSGFLVPRVEGRLLTACTWTSSKWPHLASPGRVVLRASAGRAGDTRAMEIGDDELASRLHGELTEAMGIKAQPLATRVTRWQGSFPQYRVGHLERVARIESAAAAAGGVAVAGAALRGVGIPACISQGYTAADSICRELAIPPVPAGRAAGR